MKLKTLIMMAALAGTTALAATTAVGEAKLPSNMTWTAYNTGTSGFNQAVAFGQALKQAHGVDLRVLPGANDISRMTPLKVGRAQVSAMGIGSYFAQEGMDVFAAKGWGPQRVRLLGTSVAANAITAAVAGDAGIKTYADMKGKRVAWVVGSAALNTNMQAMLAFGGLTWDDVEKVEFSGYGASWKGMINNQVDVAIASTISGPTRELEASPRGIFWPTMPHGDGAAWDRVWQVAPYYRQHTATIGSGGISTDQPYEAGSYPYPIIMTYDRQEADLVYGVVKAMDQLYDDYKAGAPGSDGWELSRQNFAWVMPFHEGAIRYFKEKGVWTDAHQKHNDDLIQRQDVLMAAWKVFEATNPGDDDYAANWPKARAAALVKAGMNPIWED